MIPLYKAIIASDDEGLFKISLVDEPAVLTQWQAFNETEKPVMVKLEVEDEDQHIISGVIMRCNFPIYRFSKDLGEYYIVYDKETIQLMAEKMLSDNTQNCINQMHTDGTDTTAVKMLQVFVKDVENGINPAGFEDVEDGSLFASFKVYDEEIWDKVKNGDYNGFSLEGYFTLQDTGLEFKKQNNINKNNTQMSKIKNVLKSFLQELGSIQTNNGMLDYDGELEIGTEVTINDEIAADGEYEADDKIIVVADGKVTEIRDKAKEDEPAEPIVEQVEEVEMTAQKKIAQAFSETYDEKMSKIYDAIAAVGNYDCWIVEASDEYAVAEVWTSEGYKYMRYEIEWSEEGNAIIKSFAEVKPAYITEEQEEIIEEAQEEVKEEVIEETPVEETEVEALRRENAELKAQLAKPVSEPIAEQFETTNTVKGNDKLAKACRLAGAFRQ